jgi:hypothetical protein
MKCSRYQKPMMDRVTIGYGATYKETRIDFSTQAVICEPMKKVERVPKEIAMSAALILPLEDPTEKEADTVMLNFNARHF